MLIGGQRHKGFDIEHLHEGSAHACLFGGEIPTQSTEQTDQERECRPFVIADGQQISAIIKVGGIHAGLASTVHNPARR